MEKKDGILCLLFVFLVGCGSSPINTFDGLFMERLERATPKRGGYGYSITGPNSWVVTKAASNSPSIAGHSLDLNYLHGSPRESCTLSCSPYTAMWFTTPVDKSNLCDDKDYKSPTLEGNAALKINGQWHKANVTCGRYGTLDFSPIDHLTFGDIRLSVAVYFDRHGKPEKVIRIDAEFDNSSLYNAMRYVQLKSLEN